MDPLSIAGSIAGLVTLADAVFRSLSRYRKAVKGSSKEAGDLMEEVKKTSLLLHSLALLAADLESSAGADGHSESHLKMQYFHECRELLHRLQNDVPDAARNLNSTSSFDRLQARLKRPFSSSDIKEMIDSLRRYQKPIHLALAAESIAHIRQTLSRQEETLHGIKNLQTTAYRILDIQMTTMLDAKRQKILDFFLTANPGPEFEMGKKLRHEQTGRWLTEGDDFQHWYSSPNAKLWLTGIPGAGKTVLASALVTECLNRNGPDPRKAVVYFFCTYRTPRTLEPSAMLSAIAVQLAWQSEGAYDVLESYYEELLGASSLPKEVTTDRLGDVLKEMIGSFSQVYIIVDGLDECGGHIEGSLKVLRSLALDRNNSRQYQLNLALLSRDELAIQEKLKGHFDCIEITAHTEDLELYVAAELENHIASRKLRIKDVSLKDYILTELVNGAKGI